MWIVAFSWRGDWSGFGSRIRRIRYSCLKLDSNSRPLRHESEIHFAAQATTVSLDYAMKSNILEHDAVVTWHWLLTPNLWCSSKAVCLELLAEECSCNGFVYEYFRNCLCLHHCSLAVTTLSCVIGKWLKIEFYLWMKMLFSFRYAQMKSVQTQHFHCK